MAYVRPVDLVPMSDINSMLNDERLKKLTGIFSVKIGKSLKDEKKITNAVNITSIQGSSNTLHFDYDGLKVQEETTHRELGDILHNEYPDALLSYKSKTTINKTPNNLNVSTDDIFQDHEKYGSHTNFLMNRGFINLRNPYNIVKLELQKTNIWNPLYRLHLRGVLAGIGKPYFLEGSQRDFVYGRPKKHRILATEETLKGLYQELMIGGASKDLAIPSNDKVIVGGMELPISIYTLQKRQKQISMGYYDALNMENLI